MLSGIAGNAPGVSPGNRAMLKSMCYHLGRWIHLVDALDDREKDAKSGAYNPVIALGGGPEAAELARRACVYAASQAAALFDLVEMRWGREVISNVLYLGHAEGIRESVQGEGKRWPIRGKRSGVKPGASDEEIKKAYHDLVKKYHPDRFQDAAAKELANEKLKEINQAYEEIAGGGAPRGQGGAGYGGSYTGVRLAAVPPGARGHPAAPRGRSGAACWTR